MNFIAINGSPRKTKNTGQLLANALSGVESSLGQRASTEAINLYDYKYESCISCFECKRLGGKNYGKCAVKDGLTPVIEKVSQADGVIFGSPIYYGGITGKMKSFLERLLFPYGVYDNAYSSIAPKRMKTAFIYTMNVTKEVMEQYRYRDSFRFIEMFIGTIFTPPKVLYACDTYQFDDYSKYKVECFSEAEKKATRDSQFPIDCKNAFNLGFEMAKPDI